MTGGGLPDRGAGGGARPTVGGVQSQQARQRGNLDESKKLHCKGVSLILPDCVEMLSGSKESLAKWMDQREWLWNVLRYLSTGMRQRTANGCPQHHMRANDVPVMLRGGLIEQVERKEVRGFVKMFLHDEPSKDRYRPIRNCEDFNSATSRQICGQVNMARKDQVVEAVHYGDYMLQLDFAAMFDQFELAPAVRNLFCFRDGSSYFRLKTLPMGIRTAVGVAGACTERLLDFEKRSRAMSIIDNVLFVGSKEDVLHDARIFVDRVNFIGATLNEDTSDLEALVEQRGTWGGIDIDLVSKTVQLSSKSVAKTEFSWAGRETWTWRQFACHIGLLWWSVGIVDIDLSLYFPLLRFISVVSRRMMDEDARWEQKAVIWPSAWPYIERWTAIALRNEPRVVPPLCETPKWTVATDACRYGWGFVAVDEAGRGYTYGARWYADFVARHGEIKMRRSTFTESHAIICSLCKLLKHEKQPTSVLVLTDSSVAVASYTRAFNSHSYDVNECLSRLRQLMPQHQIRFEHIAGAQNPADWFSRNPGAFASEERRETAIRGLRR